MVSASGVRRQSFLVASELHKHPQLKQCKQNHRDELERSNRDAELAVRLAVLLSETKGHPIAAFKRGEGEFGQQ